MIHITIIGWIRQINISLQISMRSYNAGYKKYSLNIEQ